MKNCPYEKEGMKCPEQIEDWMPFCPAHYAVVHSDRMSKPQAPPPIPTPEPMQPIPRPFQENHATSIQEPPSQNAGPEVMGPQNGGLDLTEEDAPYDPTFVYSARI